MMIGWNRTCAAPNETRGARAKESVTDGSWPAWFTVTTPVVLVSDHRAQ